MDTKKAISMFLIVSSMLVVMALAESCYEVCNPQCLQQNPYATITDCEIACSNICGSGVKTPAGQDIRSTIKKINALGKGKLH